MNGPDIQLKTLSVVIPCHNEEAVIESSYATLSGLLRKWVGDVISDYEIVMVNNGSTDTTMHKMWTLAANDDKVVVVDLRKNYGYQGSITAGLFHADNDMIVSIDSDLQDDPEKIHEMVIKYYEGYELVLGVRSSRDTDSFFKKHASQFFYRFSNMLGAKSVYNHGDFRLMSRRLLENLKNMNERNRFLRGMILELDSRYACVYYERARRMAGKTKFDFYNLLGLAVDGITSFSTKPIRLISFLGIFMFLLSGLGLLYVLYVKLIAKVDVPGWAFTSLIIFFFGGVQSLFLGIIGEYVAKIYTEVKQRPLFNVRTVIKNGKPQ
ncbi:MAG: glycosyltransferase family 2 protein [Chitinophagaceae bacterium]|nr:glycosyltransferase family 2 protein [Chitinophagaceae bacterium]